MLFYLLHYNWNWRQKNYYVKILKLLQNTKQCANYMIMNSQAGLWISLVGEVDIETEFYASELEEADLAKMVKKLG